MIIIKPQPYKLVNHIQNYEWGTKGKSAYIPNLLGFEGKDKPYAELWIGGHSRLSSEVVIDGKLFALKEIVETYPNELLGKSVVEKFGNKIPFLLKVLSVNKALSIQTHPNKQQAIELHKNDSDNYPDNNHKPEIAIALGDFLALVGFRPLEEIENNLKFFPQLSYFIGENIVAEFVCSKENGGLKKLFSELMNAAANTYMLKQTIISIKREIEQKSTLSVDEKLFLILYDQAGIDVGLLVMFLLNVVELKDGEAIYTPAGTPHAYLKGNIIECMANSDNVVRAGLTPKFKDVTGLVKILSYEFGKPKLVGKIRDGNIKKFDVDVDEFEIEKIQLKKESIELATDNRLEIIMTLKGEASCGNEVVKKGESLLLPALLSKYSISTKSRVTIFRVTIPR